MNKTDSQAKIAVLGGGSWGIAMAVHLFGCGHKIGIWEFSSADAEMLAVSREHHGKLPGIRIDQGITISNDLGEIVGDADIIALAVPSHTVRGTVKAVASCISHEPLFVNLAKGIEIDNLKRMSEVIVDEMGETFLDKAMTLSGPSHAEEVSRHIPTTVTIAGPNTENLEHIQELFTSSYFRIYTNTDLVGVELAGSLKNVIAIAAGICDGLGFGDNTKGALLTRGLAEMTRLGLAMGAQKSTFSGLAGLGDLITTCLSRHSRNRFFGEEIGNGKSLEQIVEEMTMVAEGVKTTQAAHKLLEKFPVEMPIADEMYNILFEGKSAREAVGDLMTRLPKSEV